MQVMAVRLTIDDIFKKKKLEKEIFSRENFTYKNDIYIYNHTILP